MPGTLVNCLLEELEDRCICTDEVIESVRVLLDSFIWWNLDSCMMVRLVADSPFFDPSKLFSVFLLSKALRKSSMLFSPSSPPTDPELAASASASKPDPG
jgi:hypothetical protein